MRSLITLSLALAVASAAGAQTFEEKLQQSKPLAPKPAAQTLAGKQIVAEPCKVVGLDFLHENSTRIFKSIEASGGRLIVADGQGALHALKLQKAKPCTLVVDKTFGTEGKWSDKWASIQRLSRDKSGRVFASAGNAGIKVIEKAAVRDCAAKGFVDVDSTGTWGVSPRYDAAAQLVKLDTCTSEDWTLRESREDAKRRGPFQSIYSATVIGDRIYVGGRLAKAEHENEPNVVVAYDKGGKELLRFGSVKREFTGDRFAYVHRIRPCTSGLCVLDGNNRAFSAWDTDGKFLGSIDLMKLVGLRYPWIADYTIADDGTAWMLVSHEREPVKVSEGIIYRVSGF